MRRALFPILLRGALVAGAIEVAFPFIALAAPAAVASAAPVAQEAPVAPVAQAAPVAPVAQPAPSTPATAPPTPRPRSVRVKPRPTVPEVPPVPSPELRLTLDTPSPDGPWTLHLDNAGAVPLRVLADARLLSLEVTPPVDETEPTESDKRRKVRLPRPVRCALPAGLRPSDADDRALVVPSGRSYVEKLDPRLFCFGARDAAALVPGAKVVPHLIGSRERPVVEPIEEVEPKVASVVDLPGAPATIEPSPTPPPSKEATTPQPLTVSTPAFVDIGLGWEAEIETTVTNTSPQSTALLLRPETTAFDVTGPSGAGVTDPSPTVRCAWPGQAAVPIPEAYTHLAPKQRASIAILLSALCPDGTLRRPGLYIVRAKLDTREASGASVGVRTFTGEVLAARATRLRVRVQSGPPRPSSRPQLTPAAASPSPGVP